MNIITVTGNVGQEPEMKYFDSGSVVTKFSLAVSVYDHKSKENKTIWFKCQVWGKKGEFAGEYVKKGNKIAVTGSFFVEEYTAKDGTQKTSNCINVSDIDLFSKKEDKEQSENTIHKEEPQQTQLLDPADTMVFGYDEIPF